MFVRCRSIIIQKTSEAITTPKISKKNKTTSIIPNMTATTLLALLPVLESSLLVAKTALGMKLNKLTNITKKILLL